jgi:hypothetical protein
VKIERASFEVCDECLAGLDKKQNISINRCHNCKRTACSCVVKYRGTVGYECVPDVDDGCMESVEEPK